MVVQGGRFGALAAPGARLTRVAMRTVRANYVNLRGAEITDLQLTGCRIEELDLGSAQVLRADLTGCDIDRLVLSEAVLKDVDLRGAELSTLEGVAALRGATISPFQLTRLAPAFAEQLGILVVGVTAPEARATATSRKGQDEKTGGSSFVLNRKTVFRSLPRMSFCA